MSRSRFAYLNLLTALGSQVVSAAADPSTGEAAEFFEIKVRPLLVEHCHGCHSGEAEAQGKLKAGLRVDSLAGLLAGGDSGPALVPGEPARSRIVEAVGYGNDDLAMPPKAKLDDVQIRVITDWVRMGAPWPGAPSAPWAAGGEGEEPYDWERFRAGHWAFKPVVEAAPPEVRGAAWVHSEIDRFVLARLEAAGVEPNGPAERHHLIRRAYLDLIGLPPSPDQVDEFADDSRRMPSPKSSIGCSPPDITASAGPGTGWTSPATATATAVSGMAKPMPNAWRYRDWVVNALNADMPYDEFVVRQIAGDLLEENADPRRHRVFRGRGHLSVGRRRPGSHGPGRRRRRCPIVSIPSPGPFSV